MVQSFVHFVNCIIVSVVSRIYLCLCLRLTRQYDFFCKAQVKELHVALCVESNVLRLHVSVKNIMFIEISDGARQLHRNYNAFPVQSNHKVDLSLPFVLVKHGGSTDGLGIVRVSFSRLEATCNVATFEFPLLQL
jgi:hypothetical protein